MLTLADGATVEVGVVGIDGVVGLPVLLGAETMPGKTFIQVAGSGYRIDAELLKAEFERAASYEAICKSTCWLILSKAPKMPLATGCTQSVSVWRDGFLPVTTVSSPTKCRSPTSSWARCWVPPEARLHWRQGCCMKQA